MDNKRTYTIEINGIQQSINQVDALSDALQFLDKQIKNLEARSVNISSSSEGSSGSRVSSLQTEDKLLKQIQQTEQKIRDARREDYQSLLAQKDILKEVTNAAKERAASERLINNDYGNTMQGLKQELHDIKAVMQTTDLGSDKFQQMTQRANELTNKLKELEVATGQFGRNVGNYPGTAAAGFSKLQIEVNGTTREFDNARQALKELTNERNTLKLMGEDVGELDTVVKTLQSDIKDMSMSSAAMDNLLDSLQGIMAIASTAKGIGALFGFDNSAIEQSIQKLVALQNILQGIETIKKQMQTGEGIGGILAKGNAAIDKFSASLFGLSTNSKNATVSLKAQEAATTSVATASKGATIAVKTFSTALKGIGIGIVIALITSLISVIDNFISKQKEASEAAKKLKEEEKEAEASYKMAKNELQRYTTMVTTFNGTKKEEDKLVKELNSKYGSALGTYKTLAQWKDVLIKKTEAYCEVMKMEVQLSAAVKRLEEAYKAEMDAENYDASFWERIVEGSSAARIRVRAMAKGAREDAEKEVDKLFEDLQNKKQESGLFEFSNDVTESGKKTASAVKKVEVDIAKVRIDAMKEGLTKTLAQLELERNKRIAEAKKSGKLINEQLEAINKQYDRKMFEARISYHEKLIKEEADFWKSIASIQQKAQDDAITNYRNNNNLQLENRISGLTSGKRFDLNALTADYNSIGDAKTVKYFQTLVKELEKLNDEGKKFIDQGSVTDEEFDAWAKKSDEVSNKVAKLLIKYPQLAKVAESELNADMVNMYTARMNARQAYYKEILKLTQESADKELQIEKRKLKNELKAQRDAEIERNRASVSSVYDKQSDLGRKDISAIPQKIFEKFDEAEGKGDLIGMNSEQIGKYFEASRKEMDEWINSLKKKLVEGEISIAEYTEITGSTAIKGYLQAKTDYEEFMKAYNRLSDKEKEAQEDDLIVVTKTLHDEYGKYLERVRVETETHNNNMSVIQETHDQGIINAERETLKQRQAATVDYYTNLEAETENAMSAISNKIDKAEKKTPLGFINYKATVRELKNLQKATSLVMNDIQEQKQQLLIKLKVGEISFGDYDALISQLKVLENQVGETSANIKQKIGETFSNTVKSISDIASQLGSSLSNLVGNLGEYANVQFENQLKELDKFIEKYEEKLQEQQEITQEHANAVNDIESELSTARGDRRQQLIDSLNAQMAAQRASLANEKRLEREKKKLEDKRKEVEKEQFEHQKKVDTAQAIMSGALAITNAFSIQPTWVGIAMAAMVAAATAVQIATIKAQKYAQGGVIEGKSHAQGGVKAVVGNNPIELEGNEFIIRKKSTIPNLNLLDFVNRSEKKLSLGDFINFYTNENGMRKKVISNSPKTKFAVGGQIPTLRNDINLSDRLLTAFEDYSNRPQVVSVVEIVDKMSTVREVQAMAGL